MSFEQNISPDLSRDGYSASHRKSLGKGVFAERRLPALPPHRLILLSLALLNAALLLAAVVIGIYCAKAQNLQVSNFAAASVIAEINFFRNQSHITRAKLDAQAALQRERTNHVKLKLQIKQEKVQTDSIMGQIEKLQTEKTHLQSNKTGLEDSCGSCKLGWKLLKSSCYYFSSQDPSNSRKNWTDSRADCMKVGGDLLVISSLEEQLLISDNIPKQRSGSNWWQNGFWIGLTDVVTEGTWVWVNNVTEEETMYWRSGQPNTEEPQTGNCAAFYFYSDKRRTWYNGNCGNDLLQWICEMLPSET
ncbi:uncharacterized protein V6R79_002435 [Siganus canaliculatus]